MSAVIIVGLAAGSVLILTAVIIFLKNREFPAGGIAVTLIGLVLIGMSLWSKVEIEGGGIKITVLRTALTETAAAADEVAAQAEQAAAAAEATRRQLASLTQLMENRGLLAPAVTRSIQQQLAEVPAFDRTRLERARLDLRRLASPRP